MNIIGDAWNLGANSSTKPVIKSGYASSIAMISLSLFTVIATAPLSIKMAKKMNTTVLSELPHINAINAPICAAINGPPTKIRSIIPHGDLLFCLFTVSIAYICC